MDVVFAVQKWRPYLLCLPFRILTDHQTLKYFLKQRISTPTQHKWLLKLLGYNYTLDYKLSSVNTVPDALSRQHEFLALMGLPALFSTAFLIYKLNIPQILPQPASSRYSSTTPLLIYLFLSMVIGYTIKREYMSLPLRLGVLAFWRSFIPLRLEATLAIFVLTSVFCAISVGQVSKLM